MEVHRMPVVTQQLKASTLRMKRDPSDVWADTVLITLLWWQNSPILSKNKQPPSKKTTKPPHGNSRNRIPIYTSGKWATCQRCYKLHFCLLCIWQSAGLISLLKPPNLLSKPPPLPPNTTPTPQGYLLSPEVQISASEDSRWAKVIHGFPVSQTNKGKHSSWMPLLKSAATERKTLRKRQSRAQCRE